MKLHQSIILMLVAALLANVSCNSVNYITPARQQAEQYYKWLQAGKTDSLKTLFSRDFYTKTDTSQLLNFLSERSKNGNIVSFEYARGSQNMQYGGGEKTIEVSLTYKVTYSSGGAFAETFNFFSSEPFSNKFYGLNLSKWEDE